MKRMKRVCLLPFLLLGLCLSTFAQKSPVFNSPQGAIRGYDPVAYFKEGKPVKGKTELSFTWKGTDWHFANQQNRKAFQESPEKYAPQFGGYCAYGMAEGHKAPTDPQAWTIVDDKLYLNYNPEVKKLWNAKQPENIKAANKNWPGLANKE
jgi:YHS domain-containing protein